MSDSIPVEQQLAIKITEYVTKEVKTILAKDLSDNLKTIGDNALETNKKISDSAQKQVTNAFTNTLKEEILSAKQSLGNLVTNESIKELTNTTVKKFNDKIDKSTKETSDKINARFNYSNWCNIASIVLSGLTVVFVIVLLLYIALQQGPTLNIAANNISTSKNLLDTITQPDSEWHIKSKLSKIEGDFKKLTDNFGNLENSKKQTGKDATVQINPIISNQLGELKTELSQLKGSIPADISSKLNELTISVKNMSSAPAAPATQATTVSKPTNIEFDAKKLKDALKTEFGTLTSHQSNLSTKIDAVSSSVSGSMAQMKADLDKINKIIGAQQEAKKEPKYQPVFLVVLSKGFKPQRDAIGSILQKLATPLPDSASKTPPTILVTADGNRQNVLSMAGYNQLTITTWLDNNDLREIKVPFDFLPTIINDKAGNSGQPKHVVILAGHNYQLDKTKDLSAWDKIEKITFVFVEPPFLSNLLWENFQKIQGLRRLKNLQTDVRIIKSMKDFDASFKLEVDEVDDITRVMKAALAD